MFTFTTSVNRLKRIQTNTRKLCLWQHVYQMCESSNISFILIQMNPKARSFSLSPVEMLRLYDKFLLRNLFQASNYSIYSF